MMPCSHHYRYTQGHFVCTKCGDRRYSSRTGRRKNNKKIIIPITVAAVVLAFFILGDNFAQKTIPTEVPKMADNVRQKIPEMEKTLGQIKGQVDSASDSIKDFTMQSIPDQADLPTNAIKQNKPEIHIPTLEQKIHGLINQQRQDNDLHPLSFDTRLSDVARAHSSDMASRGYFAHDSPDGHDMKYRYDIAGYDCAVPISANQLALGAENIAQDNLYDRVWYTGGVITSYEWNTMDEIAFSVVDGWMNSAGHRQNILTPYWGAQGIGVAVSSDDKVYVTENFC